jgi:hypothetical protein
MRSGEEAPVGEQDVVRERDQLRQALASRPTIDLAKGVLMALRRCGEERAFSELVGVSRYHNIPVRNLAEAIVALTAQDDPVGVADRLNHGADHVGTHGLTAADVALTTWVAHLAPTGDQRAARPGGRVTSAGVARSRRN